MLKYKDNSDQGWNCDLTCCSWEWPDNSNIEDDEDGQDDDEESQEEVEW